MGTYKRKPDQIDAIYYNGENWLEIIEFAGESVHSITPVENQNKVRSWAFVIDGGGDLGFVDFLPGMWLAKSTTGGFRWFFDADFRKKYQTLDGGEIPDTVPKGERWK